MANIMTIHMKSGKEYDINLDPNDKTPQDMAQDFYKAIDFDKTNSVRMNNGIYLFREIEAITFK